MNTIKKNHNYTIQVWFIYALTMFLLLVILDVLFSKSLLYINLKFDIHPYIKHPVYDHTYKENKRIKLKEEAAGQEYNFTVYTNSLGFKDSNINEIALKSKKHRILFIGDSFTEGVYLNYEKTFVGIIDSALSEKNIETLNAGIASYAPSVYWRKIKYLIEDLDLTFNEVFVYLDLTDAYDENFHYETKEDNTIGRKRYKDTRKFSSIEKIKIFFKKNTTVTYFILNIIQELATPTDNKIFKIEDNKITDLNGKELDINNNKWAGILDKNSIYAKWAVDSVQYSIWGKNGNKKCLFYMEKLHSLLKKNNIKLSIAVFPWPDNIWYEDLNSIHVKLWSDWAEHNNIDFINHFPSIIKTKITDLEKIKLLEKYYILGDPHFNANGNRLIATDFLDYFYRGHKF